jgi:RNAse (barnase) inhibitor barstar
MRIIELDASNWTTVLDFYDALLPALGAPEWHGKNVNALVDSIVWGGINAVEPPYTIRISGLNASRPEVIELVRLAESRISKARKEYLTRKGRDPGVGFEIVS